MNLQFKNLSCSLGGAEILKSAAGEIQAGYLTAILGPNGCGKSTLLRSLLGLVSARGEIHPIVDKNQHSVGYLPQTKEVYWPLTCETIIELGAAAPGSACRIAQKLSIAHLLQKQIDQVSGGEKTLVLLARALRDEPDLIIADEPAAELDPAFQIKVLELLKAEAARGAAVLITMHDVNLTRKFCDRIYLMKEGRIMNQGSAEILNPENLNRIFGVSFREAKGLYAG